MSLTHVERTLTISPTLCSFCQYLISRELDCFRFRDGGIWYPERDKASMRRTLNKREQCALCEYVINVLCTRGTLWKDGEKEVGRILQGICFPIAQEQNSGLLEVSLGKADRLTAKLSVILIAPEKNNVEPPLWSSHPPENLATPRLSKAKAWLSDCSKSHTKCRALESDTDYACPTRLIDISAHIPRLVCLPASTKATYAALSHCWGRHQPITTVQSNLQAHMSSIPLSAMPKTFRDAIAIAKELQIVYIWIDSLCIIQDSASDWTYEAARMAAVYSGAAVTIAAAWGSDGTCGCFHSHHPALPISIAEKRKVGTHVTEQVATMYLRPFPQTRRYLGEAVLNTRAWTLQEIILSRRTIFFAEDQMYWYCTSLYESEDGLDSVNTVADTALNLPSLGPVARHGEQSKDLLYESWQVNMKSYSSRNLTKARDKFAALAGITEFFGKIVGDKAVAGLWRGDLGRGLMWKVAQSTHGRRDEEAIAELGVPSWSWVKIKGPVDLNVADTEMCVEDLCATVEWDGLEMTSRITDAHIRGSGKILWVQGAEKSEAEGCYCIGARQVTMAGIDPDTRLVLKVYWYMDECAKELPRQLAFLLIRFNDIKDLRKTDASVREISALVLVPVEVGALESTFRRVGMGDITGFPLDVYEQAAATSFRLI